MRKLYALAIALFATLFVQAQISITVTGNSNTTPNLNATYPSLLAALTDLNNVTAFSGPVSLTASGGVETAPAGGYVINFLGQTTTANTVTLSGGGATLTASAALTGGNLNDAIIKIIGSDNITIQGFTLTENAANTTTAAATNNMTEWGIALLYESVTNGSQNIRIQNNTIDLDRNYQNSFGIYANATHSPTVIATTATATGANGGNSGLKIYANTVTDVNNGIVIVGPTAAADHNDGIDIGGSVANANTISNFGSTGTFSGYVNVSGTVNGILIRNSKNIVVSNNAITSSNGGVTSGTINGIQFPAYSNAPTGTFSVAVDNNVLSIKSASAGGTINGINILGTTSSATSTITINGNDFNNFGHTVAGSGTINFLSTAAAHLTSTISSNTFTNLNVNTTGSVNFIVNNATRPANATSLVSNNSIVTGFTKTGAGGTVQFYNSNSTSPTTVTETNTNNNFSNVTVNGSTGIVGWQSTDGPTGTPFGSVKIVTNNTFTNITGGTAAITVMNVAYSFATGTNNVSGNVINNVSSAGTIIGILSNTASQNIFNNTINALSSTGASSVTGISITGGTTQNVFKNKVYNLVADNAGGTVNGILVSGGTTVNIYNNLIGDLRSPSGSGTDIIRGISITSTATSAIGVAYNTIYMNATSTGANFGTSGIFHTSSTTAGTAALSIGNNIVVNTSVPNGTGLTVAFRRTGGTTAGSLANLAAANHNLYYAGTPGTANLIYHDGTNGAQTILAYKAFTSTAGTLAPRESNSVSEMPPFLSTTGSNTNYLHLDPAVPTQAESGGTPVAGITDDFDGNTRNATTPDIGADEFNGISADFLPPTITFTPLQNSCASGARTFTATITDASGVPTSGPGLPVVYWKTNSGSYVAATAVSLGSNQYQFTIGAGTVAGDVISYYIVAQDNASTPNVIASPSTGAAGYTANPPAVATAPTTPASYSNFGSLSGTFTVGAGGNYPTLTAAIADYNTKCLSGNVVFNLTDANYSTNETFPIVIGANINAGPSATLTIKPAAGVTAIITGSVNSNGLIRLDGADYVTIEGSNNGTSSQNLSIINSSTTAPTAIAINSIGAGAGASFNTIRNVLISTGVATASSYGISIGGATPGTQGADNDNNTIQNTNITIATVGIYAYGIAAVSAGGNDNLTITGNTITTNTSIATTGILLGNGLGGTITQNVISVETSAAASPVALSLETGFINATVTLNRIIRAVATNTGGWGGRGITIAPGTATGNILVANNTVGGVAGTNWTAFGNSSSMGIGIGVLGSANSLTNAAGAISVYHNSVSMTGSYTSATANTITTAIYIGSAATALNIRNNIFANEQQNTGNAAKVYAIYSAAPNTAFTTIDYNDYWVEGPQGVLGYLGSDRVDLTAIQTGFGGNTASKSFKPFFVSATDLHLTPALNGQLDNLGTPIAGVTTDIDGTTRSASSPDMGADEFTAPSCTGAVGGTATAGATAFCNSGSTTITGTGFSTGAGGTYQWQVSTDNVNFTDIANANNPLSLATGTLTATTYYRLKVTCNTGTAQDFSSTATVTVNPLPTVSVTPNSTICPGSSITLTATGNANTYSWAPATDLNTTTGASVVATPTVPTTYVVTGTITASGCTNTASVSLLINPSITVTASAAQPTICAGGNTQLTASAVQNVNPIKITEVTVFRTGTGQTPTYPSYIGTSENDFVELSNISSASFDISGYTLTDYSNNTATSTHSLTFPAGTVIPSNGVIVVHLGTGTNNTASGYYNTGGTTDNWSSTSQVGVVLKNGSQVIDAVGLGGSATGSYTFAAGTGVATSDFSGFAPNASGLAGVKRTAALDNNTGADWTASGTSNVQSIGTYNGGYSLPAAAFTYAWTPATGLSSTTIANPVASPTATQVYTVTATETATGCSSTATVTVTVSAATVITTQPSNVTVCTGASASFTVAATGNGTLTYQWRKGGVNIPGATSATYTIPSVTAADAGIYDVDVTGGCGSVTSSAATLATSGALAITTQPLAQTACPGGTVNFTVAATGGGTLTYQWRKAGANITGATGTTLTLTNVTAADAASYDVVVTGSCGSITSSAAALTVNASPIISTQPAAQTVCAGAPLNLSVTATGAGTLTYQWRKGGVNINGATSSSYQVTTAAVADAGSYDVVITSACGNITSNSVTVTVNPKPVADYTFTAAQCPGTSYTYTSTSTVSAGSISGYDWSFGNTNTSNVNPATNSYATAGSYPVRLIVTTAAGCKDTVTKNIVVNNTTAITTQTIAQTSCIGGNATFAVSAAGTTLTYQWRKGGANIAGATSNTLNLTNLTAADAANYDVVVTGACGAVTSSAVALTLNAATTITTQPVSVTACQGNVTFSVAATGTGTLTYQWRFNGTAIPTATTSSISVPVVTASAGNYDVIVTGTCGPVTSSAATLTVQNCTSVPDVTASISDARLLPNPVQSSSLLRVNAVRVAKISWTITDMNGRIIKRFDQSVTPGINDHRIFVQELAAGMYQLSGVTAKGDKLTLRFSKF